MLVLGFKEMVLKWVVLRSVVNDGTDISEIVGGEAAVCTVCLGVFVDVVD